jgi:hypothetical protein
MPGYGGCSQANDWLGVVDLGWGERPLALTSVGEPRSTRSPDRQIAVPDPRIFVTLSKADFMRLFSMTPARFRRSTWLTHRSLDLFVLASSACLLSFLSQPIAAALNQP